MGTGGGAKKKEWEEKAKDFDLRVRNIDTTEEEQAIIGSIAANRAIDRAPGYGHHERCSVYVVICRARDQVRRPHHDHAAGRCCS